jgi:hypothetical protein
MPFSSEGAITQASSPGRHLKALLRLGVRRAEDPGVGDEDVESSALGLDCLSSLVDGPGPRINTVMCAWDGATGAQVYGQVPYLNEPRSSSSPSTLPPSFTSALILAAALHRVAADQATCTPGYCSSHGA